MTILLSWIFTRGTTPMRTFDMAVLHALHSSSKETQLLWTYFPRWPWVTDPDPGSCTFCQMILRVTCKKLLWDIPHGSVTILTWLSTCHFGLMTKPLKSHCNQCKLGIFSKWCISFRHECGKMKYTTKFIYLHSSQKETQLSMLRFFWRRVYDNFHAHLFFTNQTLLRIVTCYAFITSH